MRPPGRPVSRSAGPEKSRSGDRRSQEALLLRRRPEAGLFFPRFQGVVADGTVRRAVDKLPHARGDRAVAFHHVWEEFAVDRTPFVHRADIAFEEHATLAFFAAQNDAVLVVVHRIVAPELVEIHAEKLGELLRIARRDRRVGHAATVAALLAVDGVFDFGGQLLELAHDEDVTLQMFAKTVVFRPFLFAEALDLNEVGEHKSTKAARTCL